MTDVVVPTAVPLKGIPDVELVAIGSWAASTGPVTLTADDLRAGVSALDCPGIHKPVLKLGHEEPDPDESKMRWDGTPAVGWISNMRMSHNDAKIIGDYTGVPGWLADVMASAYPQRSVEFHRNHKCQIGHTHPFVITAVSLLGVYPPAVGVIRGLNDVQALYTLAADVDGPVPSEVTRSISIGLAAPNADTRRLLTDIEVASAADFDRDRDEWERAIDRLLSAYGVVQRRQREQLTAQIAPLIDGGRLHALADMVADSAPGSDALYEAMVDAAQAAIALQIAEAAAQGVTGLTAVPDEFFLRSVADGIAATMASSLSAAAGRNAAQLAAPGAVGADVAAAVDTKLSDLSDRFLRDQFGGAIGAARMSGRHTVLSVAPNGQHYAAEVNDSNTCKACKAIDGRRFDSLDEASAAYGAGGYQLCSGGGRCRGRLITVWEAALQPAALTIPLRVGDKIYMARLKFNPNQKRDADGKWGDGPGGKIRDAISRETRVWKDTARDIASVLKPRKKDESGRGPTDADLVKEKPWVEADRGVGAPGVIYSDEAELASYRLLEAYSKAEPAVTRELSGRADASGGRMEGLDFRLKGQESLARKIEQKSATKGLTMQEYAAKIGDALRYTMIVPDDQYGESVQRTIQGFREADSPYEVEVENTWQPGSAYKGINTNMKRDGVIFEVQFHTQKSFDLKMEAHVLYEKARDTTASPEDRAAATQKMIDNAAALADPPGAADVV